jgi:predicted nucleic acid-binding protein
LQTLPNAILPLRRTLARLDFSYPPLLSSPHFIAADLGVEIVVKAEELYAIREQGDRLIAATAAVLDLPLVTRDPEIAKAAGVELLW